MKLLAAVLFWLATLAVWIFVDTHESKRDPSNLRLGLTLGGSILGIVVILWIARRMDKGDRRRK